MKNNVTHIMDGALAKRRYHNEMAIFYGVKSGNVPKRKEFIYKAKVHNIRKDKENGNQIHSISCNSIHNNGM